MTVQIDTTARTERVRLENQDGAFGGDPAAGYSWLYTVTGSFHGGLFLEKEDGAVYGPFITGSAGSQVLLHDETLGASGRFDVSSIDQNYQHLLLHLIARSDQAVTGDNIDIFFNNDTTAANYHRQNHRAADGAANVVEAADSSISVVPGSSSPANSFGYTKIFLPLYADTNYLRLAFINYTSLADSGIMYVGNTGLSWEDGGATAINRITIQPNGYATDEFITTSRLQIVGVRYT